jgi:hypothetical protein
MDWSVWRGLGITSRVSPRFAHLLRNRNAAADRAELATAEEIRQASASDRIEMVGAILRSKAGILLGIDGQELETDRPLLELGLDSLMAVEMRNWIASQIEVSLPISALMRNAGLNQVTEAVCQAIGGQSPGESIAGESGTPQETISADQADALLDELPELADDQVAKLLTEMLREQKGG